MNIPISQINDDSGTGTIEEWDSFNMYVLLNEIEKEFNIKFFETSAKENIGVKEAFSILSAEVKTRILSADYTEEEYKVDAIRLTGSNKPKDSNHSSCSC